MTVSVIIPYSPEHTPAKMLEEAKESVNKQSVPTELIVIEDTEQRGPAWARNKGLNQASTRYVALLDADDLWREGKLTDQLNSINKQDAGICVEGDYSDTHTFMKDLFLGNIDSLTSSILIDTEKVDIRFNEDLDRREDHLFILEASSKANACFVDNVVKIRKQKQGLSSKTTSDMWFDQNEKFIKYASQRIEGQLVSNNEIELYRRLYYQLGRSKHQHGQYKSAISDLKKSLSYGFSLRTIAAIALSTIISLYSDRESSA